MGNTELGNVSEWYRTCPGSDSVIFWKCKHELNVFIEKAIINTVNGMLSEFR